MSSKEAAELKQQGAIEAAANPENPVTADAAENKILEESRKAGAAAFSFNPDASLEEKKAQAKAVRPHEPRFRSCTRTLLTVASTL
jgi:hypothetical protein